MKIKLLIYLTITAFCLNLASCSDMPYTDAAADTDAQSQQNAILSPSEDFGEEYIDSFIFVGESTTYHLKSRGVLKGGRDTRQVWATEAGTLNLDLSTPSVRIIYPPTREKVTIAEAAARERPKYMIFTFGLNGAVQNIKRGREYYKSCYLSLINSVREASPETKIILQSAPPVASNMDMSNYSVELRTLNEYIDTINSWSLELAAEEELRYLNTAEIMKNESGELRYELQAGDGHHLTEGAYLEMLNYIRTHGYK